MRAVPWQAGLCVAGLLTVPVRLLSVDAAADVGRRVGPVLVFLVAVTVLAELAERAEVFDVAAGYAARAGRGRTRLLFGVIALLSVVVTVALSLDTTAVLLTPVVLGVAVAAGVDPLPFALLTVWLANTASLLLPVSNLTNLLAADRDGLDAAGFAARMLLPEVVAVGITVLVLLAWFRARVRGRYPVPPRHRASDPVLLRLLAVLCLALGPAVSGGVPPAVAATVLALLAALATGVRRRAGLRGLVLPWRLLLFVVGLFLLVAAAGPHGLDRLLVAAGSGGDFRLAGVAAVASNGLNNLPAYLALERTVPPGSDLLVLLVGTNAGPLVLLWGSLATLLWRERCRARGVEVSALAFARLGIVGVPLVVVATTAALRVTL